jgi:hypothetical protein
VGRPHRYLNRFASLHVLIVSAADVWGVVSTGEQIEVLSADFQRV